MSEQPPEDPGGGGAKKGPGLHLPMWGWALIVGGVGGLVWFVRHRASTAAAATTAATDTSTASGEAPTDIIPVDMGGDDAADAQLLAAINKLQGPPSTTPLGPGGGTVIPIQGPPPHVPSPTPTPTHKPPGGKPPAKGPQSQWVKVTTRGMSFSSIARQYGHTWRELWDYQLQPGVRPAATQAQLRKRGPSNSLFNMSEVAVPASWKKKK